MREPAISPIVWDPMCTPARYAAVVQRLLRVIAVKAVENVWLVAEAAQNKKDYALKMYLRRKSEWQEILPLVFIAKNSY